jgi:formylglycine-generating enzyme required for sulfatase activity
MEQKTVFISYRRALSKHLARSIYMDLRAHEWDVFLDVNTIDSGDFDRIILNQIGARAHFILLISPGSLERCSNSGDWVLREIEEAIRLERNIVPIIEEGADFIHEISHLPEDLRLVISKKNALPLPHYFFDAAVEMLRNRFLKSPQHVRITEPPAEEQVEVQRRLEVAESVITASATDIPHGTTILPTPFDWIKIPGKSYSIAKYPITNAQYAKFIEAEGYQNSNWWTNSGWAQCEKRKWVEPRYWNDKEWNSAEQPVVGISWHEAVAFCHWVSAELQRNILLPTEEQWQYAAQGDDNRTYPWGNDWNCENCNNSVKPCKSTTTTSVLYYEGKINSPFGVVDMVGNVWEWCLTDYMDRVNDINVNATLYTVRGGSWSNQTIDSFRCDCRDGYGPNLRYSSGGFRICCLD